MNIMDSERNRPNELQNEPSDEPINPEAETVLEGMRQALEAGMSPQELAEHVFTAIREERFYIFTHPEYTPVIRTRMEDIVHGRNPTIPLPFLES